MKKIEFKVRKTFRNMLKGISLTAVAFAFQACYGPMDGWDNPFRDVKLTGTVVSENTNLPIQGIKVVVSNSQHNYGITDENGNFDFYASVPTWDFYDNDSIRYTPDSVRIHFHDIDGAENGFFNDTTVIVNPTRVEMVRINMAMREVQ